MTNETTESLGIYREMFRFMLSAGLDRFIHNDSKDHACVLIEELFRFAKESVFVFCHNLGRDVWDNPAILSALGEVLDRKKVKVQVLLQDTPEGGVDNRAFALLHAHSIDVRKTHNTEVKANFIVVDHKAYRFEKNDQGRKGYACSNNPDNAGKLIDAFNILKSDSELVSYSDTPLK